MQTIYLKWYVVGTVLSLLIFLLITIHVHMKDSIVTRKVSHWKLRPLRKENSILGDGPSENQKQDYIKSKLIEVAQLVQTAKVHVRGTKSGDALRSAVSVIDDMLRAFDLNFASVTRRAVQESQSVCPEIYKGSTFGYPFFYNGFEQVSCGHRVAEEKLVTVVIQLDHFQVNNITTLLNDVIKYNRNMSVIVGVYTEEFDQFQSNTYSRVLFKTYNRAKSKGHIWNNLIEHVQTPYVLVARDLIMFNNDTRLHRLIREIERLELTSAGGASRDSNGYWELGCLQRAYKNHTLVYEGGYQESIHECVFCDQVESAFVISKTIVSKVKFDESISGEGMWEDFFLRAGGESVVCPDAMFYINRTSKSSRVSDWKAFGEKYDLKKLKFLSSKLELDFGCSGSIGCFRGTGFSVTPCCLEELAILVTFIMNACAKAGVICELQEGTLLGAVKLQKVLPWERDADITFLTANYSQFQNIKNIFGNAGYSFHDGSSLWCCVDNRTAGGKFKISSKHWHAELYGQHIMDSELLRRKSLMPTKLLFHGGWVNVPRNPGLHVRNRYGHEVYAHSQHWLATGKSSGWINYETQSFTKCPRTGSHNCLDRYNSDGNIQFIDPIP
ncbi:uncharacterized protein LOC117329487 [Pecten maximus]|uniref:uncharacterized protein LOC117329487 n=1 Tax=Pecten maximus TaxID=6579 RepID=UPI001457EBCF|nr:uncharacterized protein LOC117329487 [Pecten maximus]XP_033743340.1 uncharacterized protein LOC117329487 [Pecten maximus]